MEPGNPRRRFVRAARPPRAHAPRAPAPRPPAGGGGPGRRAPPPGGGGKDAAVVVGVESYAFVAPVPGARRAAEDWQAYLTETLGAPEDRVTLLRDDEATLEAMRRALAGQAAKVEPGGTLWFVFIGHGAPSKDGKDGLLVGADAQAKADSLDERSLRRSELLEILSRGRQTRAVALLDACFSGRDAAGQELVAGLQPLIVFRGGLGAVDARTVLLTAAAADQFAGPLPDSPRARPAFSYLALGALRGWAADASGAVTARALVDFAKRALSLAHDRTQTPELAAGAPGAVLGRGREAAPDLAKIERDAARPSGGFQVSAEEPLPAPREPPPAAKPLDFSGVDVAAWSDYESAYEFERGDAAPAEKARRWRELAVLRPEFDAPASRRAAQWESYAARQDEAAAARSRRAAARDADWEKLRPLTTYEVVPEADKRRWAKEFVAAYLPSPGLEPGMARALAPLTPPGREREALEILSRSPGGDEQAASDAARAAAAAGLRWRREPGEPPADAWPGGPSLRAPARPFEIADAPVTAGQYRRCGAAGACTPLADSPSKCGYSSADGPTREAAPAAKPADDRPAVCVTWAQASAFSQWVGGRLPTAAEWQAAAERGVGASPPECARTSGDAARALCDDGGAVREWTQDWRPPSLVAAPANIRGEFMRPWNARPPGWFSPFRLMEAASRFSFASEAGYRDVGFRPARELR